MGEGTRARGGGSKGFGSGGVGGRGTGPRDGANFATCVVSLTFLTRTKRRKMAFFEGCPVGWGEGTRARGGGVQGLRFWGGRWWGHGPRAGQVHERVASRLQVWCSGGLQGLRCRGGRW